MKMRMGKRLIRTTAICAVIVWCLAVQVAGTTCASWKDDVGYTRLVTDLGGQTPDGRDVAVAQVEAAVEVDSTPTWFPDETNPEFDGKTLVDMSQAPLGIYSGHATSVARLFFGNDGSLAGGIEGIECFYTGHWLGSGYLRAGTGVQPLVSDRSVANHSWVGSFSDTPELNIEILRRLDWVVDRDEYIQVVGLTNSSASNRPLLGSAFNVIAVGCTDGSHSRRTAAVDAVYTDTRPGPDLVVPLNTTSAATPVVGGAVALLLQAGNDTGLSTDPEESSTAKRNGQRVYTSQRSEVIWAVLAAGADRFTRNTTGADIVDYRLDAANRTDNGLDLRYGAGQLNINESYRILTAGKQNSVEDGGTGEVGLAGFDYDPYFGGLDCNATATYCFTADDSHNLLTAALVWNMAINGGSVAAFDGTAVLYDLDMALIDETTGATVAVSASVSDNSEHLWTAMEPGNDYCLVVSPASEAPAFSWDYALAWNLRLDRDRDLVPDDLDNCLQTANRTQIDSDGDGFGNMCDCDIDGGEGGDGAVNAVDFTVFRAAYGGYGPDGVYSIPSENWNPDADFNGDNTVNMADFNIMSGRWLHTAPFE